MAAAHFQAEPEPDRPPIFLEPKLVPARFPGEV